MRIHWICRSLRGPCVAPVGESCVRPTSVVRCARVTDGGATASHRKAAGQIRWDDACRVNTHGADPRTGRVTFSSARPEKAYAARAHLDQTPTDARSWGTSSPRIDSRPRTSLCGLALRLFGASPIGVALRVDLHARRPPHNCERVHRVPRLSEAIR